MIKIKNYPGVIQNNLGQFSDLLSKPQLTHFCEYLTGLMVCEKANIKQINNRFIAHRDYSNKDRFMTESDWPTAQVDQRRIELIKNKLNPLNHLRGI